MRGKFMEGIMRIIMALKDNNISLVILLRIDTLPKVLFFQ